ncbi:MAG: hypothetical protein PHT31_06845 [Candidatus Omnitrophica bacterium]|nr:hypothetical protein [Candidatus Omnitrophota bacterium]MDD5653855.1 hypothetical protein [Candidatus Omnitrophota bacterium]
MRKPIWKRPELLVLIRGKNKEASQLDNCKVRNDLSIAGFSNTFSGCYYPAAVGMCGVCQSHYTS